MNKSNTPLYLSILFCVVFLSACLNQEHIENSNNGWSGPAIANISDGAILNNHQLTLFGWSSPNNKVQIVDVNDSVLGAIIADEEGNWQIIIEQLDEGEHSIKVVATDTETDWLTNSDFYTITIDLTAPQAAEIVSDTKNLPDPLLPAFSGKAELNSKIEIYNGRKLISNIQTGENGGWSYKFEARLPDGSNEISFVVVDVAGNRSENNEVIIIEIDTIAPDAPFFTTHFDTPIINTRNLTLEGNAESLSKITLLENFSTIAITNTDEQGNWKIDLTDLADGEHKFTAIAEDAAGHLSDLSVEWTVSVNTILPDAPIVLSPTSSASTNAKPKISGTGVINTTVEVFINDELIGETTANSEGIWLFNLSGDLPQGLHSFTAKTRDSNDNISVNSNIAEYIVDLLSPEDVLKPQVANSTTLSNTISITWESSSDSGSGIDYYKIQISDEVNFSGILFSGILTAESNIGNTNNYSFVGEVSTPYYARVQAVDFAGNTSNWSEVSEASIITQSLSTEVALRAENATIKSVASDSSNNLLAAGYFTDKLNLNRSNTNETLMDAGISDDAFLVKLDSEGNLLWSWVVNSTTSNFIPNGNLVRVTGLVTDNNGNNYVTGHFSGETTFDPGTNATIFDGKDYVFNFRNVFITKISADGSYLWTKSFQGNSWDYAHAITIDSSSNIYITGSFQSSNIDFNPAEGEDNIYHLDRYSGDDIFNPGSDVFVTKLDSDGNLIWAKNFGAQVQRGSVTYPSQGGGHSIALSSDESKLYISGSFIDVIDFTPEIAESTARFYTSGETNIFVTQLNASDGSYNWAYPINAWSADVDEGSLWPGSNAGSQIAVNSDDDAILTGYFKGEADLDGTSYNASDNNIFLTKLSKLGTHEWTHVIGSSGDDRSEGIALDEMDNIFITGRFSGVVDFDNSQVDYSLTANGNSDIFISKFRNNGNHEWSISFKSATNSSSFGKTISIDNNILLGAGNIEKTADFDTTEESNNIIGLDSNQSIYINQNSL